MNDKCVTVLPHQRAQLCVAGSVTENKCVVIDCTYKTVKVTTTTFADCTKAVVIMDGTTILPSTTQLLACQEPTPVIDVCKPAPVPFTVSGADCAGAVVTATGLPEQIIQTVPHPTAVQPTSLCPNPQLADILAELKKPRYDIEVNACNDGTDDWLLVIDKNELVAGLPTLSYTNLTTGVTQAARPANLQCASPEEVELVSLQGCVNGVTVYGYQAIKDRATTSPSIVWTLWQDATTGTLGAAPTGLTIGACVKCEVTKHFEFGYYKEALLPKPLTKVFGLYQSINAEFVQGFTGQFEVYFSIDGNIQTGNGLGANYGGDFPVTFANGQALATYLNNHPSNTAPKDVWTYGGAAGAEYLAILATDGGIAPNHVWQSMVVAHYDANSVNDYNLFKTDPTSSDIFVDGVSSCRKVEILKTLDCNDVLTLKGFELGGAPIAGFDASLIVDGNKAKTEETTLCVTMVNGEKWNVVAVAETSPCGDTTTKYMDMDVFPPVDVTADVATIDKVGCCPCVFDVDPDTTATTMEKTGAANFKGALVINAALLLSTAPAGSKLRGVDIQVRKGAPTISGSLSSPSGATPVTANASYSQTWSSSDPAELDDFTYTLAIGDEVDVFWVIKL